MPIEFTNNATSLLAFPVLAADTSVSIEAGDVWMFPVPDPGLGNYFYATLEDRRVVPTRREIVKVIDRSGAVFTVIRAQDNTAAYDFFTGAIFSHRLNAAALRALIDEEAAARIAADAAEAAARAAADAALQANITAETNARIAGDAALQSQLNAEITRAQNAEAALAASAATSADLTAEINRALAAEAALDTRITNESDARFTADGVLYDAIADLQSQIDAITGTAPPTIPVVKRGIDSTDGTGHARVTFSTPFGGEPSVVAVEKGATYDLLSATIMADANGFDIWLAFPLTSGITPAGARTFYWLAEGPAP